MAASSIAGLRSLLGASPKRSACYAARLRMAHSLTGATGVLIGFTFAAGALVGTTAGCTAGAGCSISRAVMTFFIVTGNLS